MTAPTDTDAPVDPDGLLGDPTEVPADAIDPSPEGEDAPKDWEAEYKAQQKINRDLERRSKAQNRALEQKLAEATKGKPTDEAAPDADAIRNEIRAEVETAAMRDRALDKLEAKAARRFQNPEDARAFLAARVDDFIDGTTIDTQAITDALDDLLTERPYLGVTQGEQKRFQGTGDGGPKGTAGKPQLTKADVEQLSREGKHDEINAARAQGRLKDLGYGGSDSSIT